MRRAAIVSLGKFPVEAARARLLDVVSSPLEDRILRLTAMRGLDERDPGVVAALERIAHEPPSETNALVGLAAVARLGGPDVRSNNASLLASGSWDNLASVRDPVSRAVASGWHVAPRDGERSIRCWAGPGIARDAATYLRIPAGHPIGIGDRFERDDESWVQALRSDCWIEMRHLARGHRALTPDPRPGIVFDTDVPRSKAESAVSGH